MPSYTEAGKKTCFRNCTCILYLSDRKQVAYLLVILPSSSDYIIWLLLLRIFYNYNVAYTEHLERSTVAGRGPQAHSKSYQPVNGPSPWEQKNTEVQSQVEIRLLDSKETKTCPGHSQICYRKSSAPLSRSKIHIDKMMVEHILNWVACFLGIWNL